MVARHAWLACSCACVLAACAQDKTAPPAPLGDPSGRTTGGGSTANPNAGASDRDGAADDALDAGAGASASADLDATASTVERGTPQDAVRWSDPRGDTNVSAEDLRRYPLDVREVQADVSNGELVLRVRMDRTLAQHFAFPGIDGEHGGGVPIEVLIDADDDPETGESPFWASEADRPLVGYEYEITVLLGFTYLCGDAGEETHAAGDVIVDTDDCTITGNLGTYFLWRMDGGSVADAGLSLVPSSEDERDYVSFDGDEIVVRVPLPWLQLERGDVIRLCYQESDEGPASGLGYSTDKWLTL